MTMSVDSLQQLVLRYRSDPESVYNTWFIESPARLKAFRAIRRGVMDIVSAIRDGTFGNDFKGSPLETVLESITEQKQVFEGAAHPFYWKPKLRIPDIYENERNKHAFGQFLERFLRPLDEMRLIREIMDLDRQQIRGLGPAVANILYFLHPTLFPPFNTAIVRGFNKLFGASKKLGSWTAYLEIREVIAKTNTELKSLLSTDLGALAGLLFDIGVGKVVVESNWAEALARGRKGIEKIAQQRQKKVLVEQQEENEHLKLQYFLTDIGRSLGYAVHVAANDRSKSYEGQLLSFLTIDALPDLGLPEDVAQTVALIDVIWLSADKAEIVAAFEVEKSTSIYSGILRMDDLAASLSDRAVHLFLVAPDAREKEVQAQLHRPAFRHLDTYDLRYILSSDLCEHCASLGKLGEDYRVMLKIAKKKTG